MIDAPVIAAVKYKYRRNPSVNSSPTTCPFVDFTRIF